MSNKHNLLKLMSCKLLVPDFNEELDYNLLNEYSKKNIDKIYFNFITDCSNGGFFYEGALQLYSFSTGPAFQNIEVVNKVISKEYNSLARGLCFFGQDIFGNQFAFDLENNNVVFFYIETAEKEIIGESFEKWLEVLINDFDYYTGLGFKKQWPENLELGQRLCPKKPFVIGGDYEINNLYASVFPKYLEYFADIAKQIHELPDGTPIKLKIIH